MRALEALTRTPRVSSGYTAFASEAVLALASRAVHVQIGHNRVVQPMLTIRCMYITSSSTAVGGRIKVAAFATLTTQQAAKSLLIGT